ncbi:MAG: hypothetical protein NWF07_13420, partial [Candidatus Bathyarchaeota archaeon]|nr:hypothetical protein [Candidatus Bathyarchaeota archaeon]
MSESNKKKFVSEPRNNVYLAEDGEPVQVRYRIRVVEGLGADWQNVSDTFSSTLLYYNTSNYVTPKGSLSSVSSDFKTGVTYPLFYANGRTEVVNNEIGSFKTQDNYTTQSNVAYKGLCFALPIGLVSRRNQGAFHNVFNPNGCNRIKQESSTSGSSWYVSLATLLTSTAECFSVLPDIDYGAIASTSTSGRPDNKRYDAIYESDVLDLRSSAHKVDLQRTLDREFNRGVAGEIRGWEKQWKFTEVATQLSTNAGSHAVNVLGDYSVGDLASAVDMTTGVWLFKNQVITGVSAGVSITVDGPVFVRTIGHEVAISAGKLIGSKELLHCDIIGDPANYPSEWLTNGVFGTPLLVGESGENLIPDGTSKEFKLSRKCKESVLVLYSTDSGVTWSTTTTWDSYLEGSTNSRTITLPTGDLYL